MALLGAMAGATPSETAESPATPMVGGVFIEPHPIELAPPVYPRGDRELGNDGWVLLSMMIGIDGKAKEVTVIESSGNANLEQAAVAAVDNWRYAPATIDGQPVESKYRQKVVFVLAGSHEPRPVYAKAYRRLMNAIREGDRATADAALEKLKPKNLYEDAYLGLARFTYYEAWGTPDEQLAALDQAIAYESAPNYLPKQLFIKALQQKFVLEVRGNHLSDALDTWATLREQGLSDEALADYRKAAEEIERLRTDARRFTVAGAIPERGTWGMGLLKSRFRVAVEAGAVTAMLLWCDRQRLELKFDPTLEYTISAASGECTLQIRGDSGTQIRVTQF